MQLVLGVVGGLVCWKGGCGDDIDPPPCPEDDAYIRFVISSNIFGGKVLKDLFTIFFLLHRNHVTKSYSQQQCCGSLSYAEGLALISFPSSFAKNVTCDSDAKFCVTIEGCKY